jgi:hypothetical protein
MHRYLPAHLPGYARPGRFSKAALGFCCMAYGGLAIAYVVMLAP